jgi:hypothetical protein
MRLLEKLGLTLPKAAATPGPARQSAKVSDAEHLQVMGDATRYAAALRQAQDECARLTEPEASSDKAAIEKNSILPARTLAQAGDYAGAIVLLDSVAGQVAAAKARVVAAQSAARAAVRSELDATLTQIEVIVAGLDDKTLKALVAGDAAKARVAFATADKLADVKAATKGFVAAKHGAEQLLAKARAVNAIAEWVKGSVLPLVTAAEASIDKVGAAGAKAALKKACAALKGEIDKRAAAIDLAGAQSTDFPKLQALAQLAADLVQGSVRRDDDIEKLRKAIDALATEATPEVKDTLASLTSEKRTTWPAGTTVEQVRASVTAFDDKLKTLGDALKPLQAAFDARIAYEQATVAMKADLDHAVDLRAHHVDALTTAVVKPFDDAKKIVDDAATARKWAEAKAALPALKAAALAIAKSAQEFDAFHALFDPFVASYHAAWNLVVGPGVPDDTASAFWDAANPLEKAIDAKQWKEGSAAIPKAKLATAEAQKVKTQGQAYYTAYAAAKADIDKGRKALYDAEAVADRLALVKKNYSDTNSTRVEAVEAKDWAKAKNAVAPQQAAAVALVAALEQFKRDKGPFDAALAKLHDLEAAREAAVKASKKVRDVQGKAFSEKYTTFNDAVNSGAFDVAIAAIVPLQAAIDALLAARTSDEADHEAFDLALAALTELDAARALAAGPPPPLSAAADELKRADQSVGSAAAAESWSVAKAAVATLKAAMRKLLDARADFNRAASPADAEAFAKKLEALKSRTDKAAEAPQPAFAEALQKAVRDRVAAIAGFVDAKDPANAEALLAGLVLDLDAMEKAKLTYAVHLARFVAARDGEVKKARALALQPAKLGSVRDVALTKSQDAIVASADKGKLDAADARVVTWIAEAKAWAGSKVAYDSLMTATPDESKLKHLADLPGGAAVMDALVASLPPETSQRVLSTALKARYGIAVKSFDKKNKDTENLAGLTAVDAHLPNKSLQKIYEVLGKVPIDMKGKVTDVIDFKQTANGAMYDNKKKIYMYCGRPDDPNAGQQNFSEKGKIVPDGEEVSEECKPVDTAPVPYFDFALLHEAGHAEDDADKFMEKHLDNPAYGGWRIDRTPDAAAKAAAAHFKFSEAWVKATLGVKKSVPPVATPAPPKSTKAADWNKAREAALEWCRLVRVENDLWNKASLSKQLAIGNRVYQEAYDDYWVSYDYSARGQGITGYQFRSQMEWFAELYAAYFSDKLKKSHPAIAWLKKYKTPKVK